MIILYLIGTTVKNITKVSAMAIFNFHHISKSTYLVIYSGCCKHLLIIATLHGDYPVNRIGAAWRINL